MDASYERETVEDVPVLQVRGRLGVREVAAFRQQLQELSVTAIDAAVVDLSEVPSVSSRVFPLLATFTETFRHDGKRLMVVCPPALRETLEVLRLDTLVECHPTQEVCLDILRG